MTEHRSRFSKDEADQIREILRKVRRAGKNEAKSLRGKLRRKYGFLISDFSTDGEGFTASDFDEQVRLGIIRVEE